MTALMEDDRVRFSFKRNWNFQEFAYVAFIPMHDTKHVPSVSKRIHMGEHGHWEITLGHMGKESAQAEKMPSHAWRKSSHVGQRLNPSDLRWERGDQINWTIPMFSKARMSRQGKAPKYEYKFTSSLSSINDLDWYLGGCALGSQPTFRLVSPKHYTS